MPGMKSVPNPFGTYLHARGTLDFLSSSSTGLNSNLYPLACPPLGSGFPRVGGGVGFEMRKGMAEDEPFTPLALFWHPFSSGSSDLGFCLLPNTQPSWLPAQVGDGERTSFLQLLSENSPAGTAQEQQAPEILAPQGVDVRQSLL